MPGEEPVVSIERAEYRLSEAVHAVEPDFFRQLSGDEPSFAEMGIRKTNDLARELNTNVVPRTDSILASPEAKFSVNGRSYNITREGSFIFARNSEEIVFLGVRGEDAKRGLREFIMQYHRPYTEECERVQ